LDVRVRGRHLWDDRLGHFPYGRVIDHPPGVVNQVFVPGWVEVRVVG